MTTIQEINSSIMHGSFTNDQLNSIICAVKFARGQLARHNKNSFAVGAEVKFTSVRTGQTMIGLVKKVNRKNMIVQVGARQWIVPACMVTSTEI